MGENCGKQDAFRDGVLSGTGRRWGGGSVQTVIVPLFALSEIRSQTRQNCAEIGPSDARLLSGRLRFISRLSQLSASRLNAPALFIPTLGRIVFP